MAKRWKNPTDEWIRNKCYIHTMGHHSAFTGNKIQIHAITWINLEDMVNEISQLEFQFES